MRLLRWPLRFRLVSFGYSLPDPLLRQNAYYSLLDGAWFAAAVGLTTPFLGPFAITLGGSDLHVGLVTAAPALAALLGQLPAVVLTERARARLPLILSYALGHRLFFLWFAALPFLRGLPRPNLLILGLGLAALPATVFNTAWTTLMGEMFPGRARAQVFAERNLWVALATLAGTAAAGPLLDLFPYPWNWWLLFLLAFLCAVVSYLYLARLREEPGSDRRCPLPVLAYGEALRDRDFLAFLLPVAVFYAGMMLAIPMYPIIYVRKLHLANSWIATFALLSGFFSVLTYRYWGRVCDRRGARLVFALAAAAHIAFPLGYASAASAYPLLFWSASSGVFGAAFNLALFNLLLDLSPPERRPRYVALYNLAINAATLVFPLLGVAAYSAWGLYAAMGISTGGRLLGVGLFLAGARRARRPEVGTATLSARG